jgi:hypothetical protein
MNKQNVKHNYIPKKKVIQQHHISYNPSIRVTLWKGEHYILTQIQWRKEYSRGFIEALERFVKETRPFAVNLEVSG